MERKWDKDVAAPYKEQVYSSKNGGKVKESEKVGATGETRPNDINKNRGDHGPK